MLHRLSATTALSACFFGSFLVSGVAAAKDPEHYFYPKSKWVVERVESTAGRELHSCTISNTLNNGYGVQIAATANGFTNINLDLKQNVFESGKRYEVVYQIPGVKKELLATRAFQQNLLVSDLRGQTEFVTAMRESGVLDINIRGNEFRVYMTGFDAKMQGFTQCVGEGVTVAEAPKPSPDVEVVSAVESVEPAEAADIASAQADVPPEAQPEALQRFTEQIEAEIKQSNIQYKPYPDDQSKVLEETQDQLQIATEKEAQDNIAIKAQEKKPFIKKTTIRREASMDFTRPEASADVQDIEPASGTALGGAMSADYETLKKNMLKLKNEVSSLRKQNMMLDEELKASLEDGRVERASVATDNWNLERATMRFEEAERQALRLGRQLKTEKARCDSEKRDLETMLFDPKLTQQSQIAKLASLEAELEKSQEELFMQKRRYDERIKLLEAQLNAQ